ALLGRRALRLKYAVPRSTVVVRLDTAGSLPLPPNGETPHSTGSRSFVVAGWSSSLAILVSLLQRSRVSELGFLVADNPLVKGQLFPAHLPQRQNTFAANAVLLAAMDHACLGLQPHTDMRGEAQMRHQHQRAVGG